MAKVVEKSIWEQMKEAWKENWAGYCDEWKRLWGEYKSIIIPFIKGTASYAWQLFAGILAYISVSVYDCGKILVEYILKLIKKA